jgi:hypothetical protein
MRRSSLELGCFATENIRGLCTEMTLIADINFIQTDINTSNIKLNSARNHIQRYLG